MKINLLVLASLVSGLMALSACSQPQAKKNDADDKPATCPSSIPQDMVFIKGGSFIMGANPQLPEEGPPRPMKLESFWIDSHEVTNADFARFVDATGYRTVAERNPPDLAGAPADMLKPGSAVFQSPTAKDRRWWKWVPGASWRRPNGPGSNIAGRGSFPVVQIAVDDAEAYARWAGKELPTEAQWEFAARGNAPALPEPIDEEGRPQANYYQGVFPVRDLAIDGFASRAPVGCFKPNAFGIYDMIGNVWEWTRADDGVLRDVQIIKGGSFLCASNYCARYRPAARQYQERGLGTDHIGFRLVSKTKPKTPQLQQRPPVNMK